MSEDDTGDDDWFESALEEDDETPSAPETDETDGDTANSADESEDNPFSSEDPDDRPITGSDDHGDPEADDDSPFGDGDDGSDDTPFGGSGEGSGGNSPFGGDGEGGGDTPFDDGEASSEGTLFSGDDSSGDGSPFGGSEDGSAEDTPFGSGDGDGSEAGGGGGLFDDDFESAFGGSGGGGGGGDSEFADEDLDSDIPRLDLGIEGLDDMIQGGVPRRHLMVCIGSAGTGKTTFGLKFLHHGLQKDDTEKAVFITLEQSWEAIMNTANERGWEFEKYEDEDQLAVIDLDPVEMANSLQNIRAELPQLIKDFGADRLVLDSVSLLEMMYNDQAKRRTEVFDFTRSLKQAGVTTMLTSEASEEHEYASRHGIIEYLTDAVFHLRYVRQETRETRMAVEIQKIRNANHSRETKPYEITGQGISVYQQANIF